MEKMTPAQVMQKLIKGNNSFLANSVDNKRLDAQRRELTAEHGQQPYVVIVSCSDSRVPAEYIFRAGIGEVFVIRTAGHVIGEFELGSIEYGVGTLGAKLVVVMGHTGCGAIQAALKGNASGHIQNIIDEIRVSLAGETDAGRAEDINIEHAKQKILASDLVCQLVSKGELAVVGAKYDLRSGRVIFMDQL